jgi:hypothetical protein
MAAAIAARRAAANPAVDSLLTNGMPVSANPILAAIDRTSASGLGTDPAIRSALADLRAQITARAPGKGAWIAPDVLDGLRQNANKFIAQHAPNGAVSSRQTVAMSPIKDAITDAIEGANPGYKAYLADYAKNSMPINTMQAGRDIADALGTRARFADNLPILDNANFRGPFERALGAAEHGIDPAAENALRGVQSDLGRATISNSVRSGGSDTGYNLAAQGVLARMIYGPTFGGAGPAAKGMAALATAAIGQPLAALGVMGAGQKAGQAVGARLNAALADHMLNPEVLLPYLDARAAQAAQQGPGLAARLRSIATPAAVSGLLAQ